MVPFRNTSLDVRHSMDEVVSFPLSLLDGNFPGVNSGHSTLRVLVVKWWGAKQDSSKNFASY